MRTALAVHAVALLAVVAIVAAQSPASAQTSNGGAWQLQQQEERWRLERMENTRAAIRQLQQLPSGAAVGPAASLAPPPGGSAGAAMAMAPAVAASPAVAAALQPGQDLPPGSESALAAGTHHEQAAFMLHISRTDALQAPGHTADQRPMACRFTEGILCVVLQLRTVRLSTRSCALVNCPMGRQPPSSSTDTE